MHFEAAQSAQSSSKLLKDPQRSSKILKDTSKNLENLGNQKSCICALPQAYATGNWGDDFRTLKLAKLQPHTLLHPNKETAILAILGLQGKEKAGKCGLKTMINPSYMTFIPQLNAEQCPFGAFSFYVHYLFNVKDITLVMNIHWAINKSWHQARVLHGPNSPTSPYSEQSLYNLYVRAFKKVNFELHVKQHLPRHCLGYRQEALGLFLEAQATKSMKHMIPYEIHDSVVGKLNLSGAANFWRLVMDLRPYVFQVLLPTQGFSIQQYQCSYSQFKLPILATPALPTSMLPNIPPTSELLLPVDIIPQASTDAMGIYEAEDSTLWAYVSSSSSKAPSTPQSHTQVDLVLPPMAAFLDPTILIPILLWDCYKPSKSLDQWESLNELWNCWTHNWHKGNAKQWECFHEIPEYVDQQVVLRNVSPHIILAELEELCTQTKMVTVQGKERTIKQMMGINALKNLLAEQCKHAAACNTMVNDAPISADFNRPSD
ncbi:hypothetical protein F5878DRAFT_640289 [Lentinula raphanica]|uniref:Ndc10 domain-containing protein n=1 Tax=Lentinula raphanica TaxID=153919 RepID=A0AA38PCT3_9AGAR|nr:hypothetical protein F5878DRAFT_640289 [Lentinula raphanica]